ncbi:hypothetical protein RNI52_34495 [Labrys neptuniae]|nr:hypothetical protein [Labrys neptuniae]MDT3382487.1 hypothetical protein [Labrys neptuniae]
MQNQYRNAKFSPIINTVSGSTGSNVTVYGTIRITIQSAVPDLEICLYPIELLDAGHLDAEGLLARVAHDEKSEAVSGYEVSLLRSPVGIEIITEAVPAERWVQIWTDLFDVPDDVLVLLVEHTGDILGGGEHLAVLDAESDVGD